MFAFVYTVFPVFLTNRSTFAFTYVNYFA